MKHPTEAKQLRRGTRMGVAAVVLLSVAACSSTSTSSGPTPSTASPADMGSMPGMQSPSNSGGSRPDASALPGMPAVGDPNDVYAADRPNQFSAVVRGMPYRIYVPNTRSNSVTVIDPVTYRVIATYQVGNEPQHVVPSWDLKTLWVNNDLGNSLTPINPRTTKPGRAVEVRDPYNLYFTPDGKHAVVMASKKQSLDFRDPHTMALQKSVHVPCLGVNHADWTASGRFFLVSCEFSGDLLWVDTVRERVVTKLHLSDMAKPQDVKLSPDGTRFYVADMMSNGVWIVGVTDHGPKVKRLLPTGSGAHGLYVSRDSERLFIGNRGEGSVSVLRFSDDTLVTKWRLPGGGSPDMGGVSPDGKVLWLSGRFNNVVYAISTETGALLARIRVGSGPHGLAVYPQPGRYSLGHTGVFR